MTDLMQTTETHYRRCARHVKRSTVAGAATGVITVNGYDAEGELATKCLKRHGEQGSARYFISAKVAAAEDSWIADTEPGEGLTDAAML